ncbi:MAG: hypothetical protein FWB90_06090 [Fibromonadales bacterium]|nr:hypothetical protein [Fibromonadales bacterium]
MSLPPINRLWRGIVFFVFLLFALFSVTLFKKTSNFAQPEEEVFEASTEICLLVAASGPVNVDTVFSLKADINRIFAYSSLGTNYTDTVWHTWYRGTEMIKNTPCKLEDSACFSSISADSLEEGNWSVDTRRKGILLSIKQFKIEK